MRSLRWGVTPPPGSQGTPVRVPSPPGGGVNRKNPNRKNRKKGVHPPTGGVLDPRAGESKDPHWGGVEIQIIENKKITMEKIEKIGVPSHPPCGGSRLGGVSPILRGSMDPHWGGLEISLGIRDSAAMRVGPNLI